MPPGGHCAPEAGVLPELHLVLLDGHHGAQPHRQHVTLVLLLVCGTRPPGHAEYTL